MRTSALIMVMKSIDEAMKKDHTHKKNLRKWAEVIEHRTKTTKWA